ncbi:MAG: hypothetical protein ACAI25_01670 [Planctomycetota bacterium]
MRALGLLWAVLALAAVSLAEEPAKGPLERAKVGQWVHYKMANDMTMKQSVIKVEGKKVTIKNEMWIKGQALPANETPIDIDRKPDPTEKATKAEAIKTEDGELEINGHKLKCKILTQANVKTWVSDDVPITGVVRQELNGKPTMELQGYGYTPEEDRLKKS